MEIRLLLSALAAVVGLAACASLAPVGSGKPVGDLAEIQTAEISKSPMPVEATRQADLLYELLAGEFSGVSGKLQDAVGHYSRASDLTNDPAVAARTARIALFAKQYPRALRATERWLALAPNNVEAHQMAGLLLVRMDRPEEAVEHLSQVIEHGQKNYDVAFTQLGLLLGQDSVTPAELKAMQLLRERYAKVARAQRAYAELAFRAGDMGGALAAIEDALKLEPNDATSRTLRSRILITQGRGEEAIADMRKLVRENPEDEGSRQNYARMLVQVKRYDEALREFERLLKAFPGNADLQYSVALLLIELKRYPKAKIQLERLLESDQYEDEALYYLGRIAQEEKDYAMAMARYLRVQEGEFAVEAQIRVSDMLNKLGQMGKARDHLRRVRAQVHDDGVKLRLLLAEGQLLRDSKRYQEAYDFYTEALRARPDDQDLLYARSMVAEKLDRLDLLEQDLRAILAKEPDNATALNALGYTLADRTDRYAEALQYIEKALAQKPDDPAILDSMGWVKYRLGALDEAEQYLRQAYAKLQDAEIAAHLAEVLLAKGDSSKARELVRKALETAPEDERLVELRKRLGL